MEWTETCSSSSGSTCDLPANHSQLFPLPLQIRHEIPQLRQLLCEIGWNRGWWALLDGPNRLSESNLVSIVTRASLTFSTSWGAPFDPFPDTLQKELCPFDAVLHWLHLCLGAGLLHQPWISGSSSPTTNMTASNFDILAVHCETLRPPWGC